jgi:RNA polymerase sigma-70 factor, ECF subfamily
MRLEGDRALVEALRASDEAAVAELARTYGGRVSQLALRYLKNREDAEEVTQDVLLKVVNKIDAFRGDSALSSWIYRITFNTAMSRLRNGRSGRAMEVADDWLEPAGDGPGETGGARREVADWSSMADEEVLRGQMRRRLAIAIRELPPIYRAPVILRDLHGMTTEEASRVLRVKDQTLKSRLHRGRVILRQRLADFASGLSLHQPRSGVKRQGDQRRARTVASSATRWRGVKSGSITEVMPQGPSVTC